MQSPWLKQYGVSSNLFLWLAILKLRLVQPVCFVRLTYNRKEEGIIKTRHKDNTKRLTKNILTLKQFKALIAFIQQRLVKLLMLYIVNTY